MHPTGKRRVLALTFIGSVATSLIELGLYFYTHDILGFSELQNLGLALGWGLIYLLGALISHPIAHRFGERNLAIVATLGQAVINAIIGLSPTPAVLVPGFLGMGLLTGMMWPVIESYISSGLTPRRALNTIGYFNLTWSSAVAVALVLTGQIMTRLEPNALLFVAAGLNLAVAAIMLSLRARPLHMDHDHPERPSPEQLQRWKHLLVSSRWTMLASYALLFLLSPLLPEILSDLGLSTEVATNTAALIHGMRFLTFAAMIFFPAWHDRVWPLLLALVIQPVSLILILFGTTIAVVIAGEIMFGIAAGLSYFAALYYVQVIQNASVEAGGEHEGLIGAGFAIGPLLGLGATVLGGSLLAVAVTAGPFLALTAWKATSALRRSAQHRHHHQ
ncbi:MFS transporter [Mucisphaera calidilacus]|uniref:Major Facilitator Superfamily protein n=1 Tax=Mucisphaera calidilacus TaxID=2527982 RepID=A0A518BVG9_9BACT|nr:MFS transporter [Mucisphaera calidilacus]QDU70980.1 Major Facilitator Superfamily protein [Mucisphaera calidilacus]